MDPVCAFFYNFTIQTPHALPGPVRGATLISKKREEFYNPGLGRLNFTIPGWGDRNSEFYTGHEIFGDEVSKRSAVCVNKALPAGLSIVTFQFTSTDFPILVLLRHSGVQLPPRLVSVYYSDRNHQEHRD